MRVFNSLQVTLSSRGRARSGREGAGQSEEGLVDRRATDIRGVSRQESDRHSRGCR